MTREEWLIEAKVLFHTNLPNATASWVDQVTETLCSQFGDLEPDEAVALYVATQAGARSAGALTH
jgi:hypothetical protein